MNLKILHIRGKELSAAKHVFSKIKKLMSEKFPVGNKVLFVYIFLNEADLVSHCPVWSAPA